MNHLKSLLRKLTPFFALRIYHYILSLIAALTYGLPARKIKVVAVTGTKGKSSTAEIINAILEEAGFHTALASTIRFKIDEDNQPNLLKMTMPGRGFLQRFLYKAVKADCQYAIVEMTSEGTKLYRHWWIDLDALVFTNLSPEHIESHGSFEKYREAKLKIRDSLSKSKKPNRSIIANTDDETAEYFLQANVPNKLKFNLAQLEPYKIQSDGSTFTLDGQKIKTNLPGKFNLYNILASITYAKTQNVDMETIKNALAKFGGIPGRMEKIVLENITTPYPTVYVDYAHTPDSLTQAYEACGDKKLICVLGGTGGGRDQWKRKEMGSIADKYCAHIIVTNEDPYDENPQTIIDMVAEGVANKPVEKILDRREAISKAISLATPNDVVIITGKGTDPFIMGPNGSKQVWSDSKVAREEMLKIFK